MAKYKVGDKVRVISNGEVNKTYYMEDKSDHNSMVKHMLKFCGKVVTIRSVTTQYYIEECGYGWVDEMFEGLAEEDKPGCKFKVGDRVKSIKGVGNKELIGVHGIIKEWENDNDFLVEFDIDIGGHDGGVGCKNRHCWWCSQSCVELLNEEPKKEPTPTPVTNINITVNLYENACWYCRKGGLVDLYLAGAMGICPSCGRVCNNTLPTKPKKESIVIEFKPHKRENKPLTTKELEALPDGTRVFTVDIDCGTKKENLIHEFTCWRTKRGGSLDRNHGAFDIDSNGVFYNTYLEKPEGAVDSGG